MTDEFELIYQEYKNLIYNLCLHYVLNAEDAQDVTQDVFVKVYQRYHQFNPTSASLKTWIYQIAIHHCLDFLKAKKTKKRFGFLTSLFQPDTQEPVNNAVNFNHPGIEMENKESLQKLLMIIQSLPENQKTAIILSKIEDRPQKEVAEIMNISTKAVESLLQRAKNSIQKKLTESEGL
jgi:RNA polymerase sigma-70 factor, ECF subfamily